MPRKNPLGMIKDAASETIKDPIGTATRAAGHALHQARGTVEVGKVVAGQVTKSAAGVIGTRVPGRKAAPKPTPKPAEPGLRAVQPSSAAKPAAKPAAKKAPPKKATKPPVTDVATELVKEQAAHQPVAKQATAPGNPIDAAADGVHVDATPADVAKKVAGKAPAKRATKKATAKKAPATKVAAKAAPTKSTPSAKLPAKKTANAPKTAAEVLEDADLPSPVESIGNPPSQN